MNLQLHLTPSGSERLAKPSPEEPRLYSWDFHISLDGESVPQSYILLKTFSVKLPDHSECTRVAVADLQRQIQERYAEAEKDVKRMHERLAVLLAIEGPQ